MGSPRDPPGDMEDAHAQFLIAVGDLCVAAEVGGLTVELLTGEGESTSGVPVWVEGRRRDDVDEMVYGRTFRVGNRLVDLNDVVACTIRAPHVEPSPPRSRASVVGVHRDPGRLG